eukprot:m.71492 g.71492  ORF g.71492 m.71492 type:complete len:253 (-) comp8711_c0_seq4:66-824(-)
MYRVLLLLYVRSSSTVRGCNTTLVVLCCLSTYPCLQIYCKLRRTAFAATLRSELANALVVFGKLEEAAEQYSAAALLLDGSPLPAIAATESACECKIRLREFAGALDCIGTILDTIKSMRQVGSKRGDTSDNGSAAPRDDFWVFGKALRHSAYGAIVARCEITAVLLLLQLPRTVRDAHRFSTLLSRYRGDDGSMSVHPPYMSESTHLLLQSVLQAEEDEDVTSLQSVQSDLWFPLTASQNELLYSLSQRLR